jgi:hypothetical protein
MKAIPHAVAHVILTREHALCDSLLAITTGHFLTVIGYVLINPQVVSNPFGASWIEYDLA